VLLLPLLIHIAALLCFLSGSARVRWLLLLGAAVAHAATVGWFLVDPPSPIGWLRLDALGLLFLAITSALFLLVSIYLGGEARAAAGRPERVFAGSLLFFLAAMTLVTTTQHLGLIWVAVEATTLASAPLIYHHRTRTRWKQPGNTWCYARWASPSHCSAPSCWPSRLLT